MKPTTEAAKLELSAVLDRARVQDEADGLELLRLSRLVEKHSRKLTAWRVAEKWDAVLSSK